MDVLQQVLAQLKASTGLVVEPGMLKVLLLALSVLAGLGVLAALLGKLWKKIKPLITAPTLPALCGCEPAAAVPVAPGWIARISLAIDYLRTRREWRYATPWFMLLGQQGAGKSSLLASVSPQHWQPLTTQQQKLQIDGATWHAIGTGLILDVDGKLPVAAAQLALAASEPMITTPAEQMQAQHWRQLLDQLDMLRPERPLDGIVLLVSARTLLCGDPQQYQAAAQNARQQLRLIEERFEFALPVYVVVSACDSIDGFSAFWRSQLADRRNEMIGWSMPTQENDETPTQWGAVIFESIGQQLRALQVDAAAHCERIAAGDADQLFLYPHHFEQMQGPFQQWLSIVFQTAAWQTSFFLRGVYFTGAIAGQGDAPSAVPGTREDVAFVDDLLIQKVLPEIHLGRPTRAGVWSRNLLIRRLQWLAILAFTVLLMAGGIRAYELNAQIQGVLNSLKLMQQLEPPITATNSCIAQAPVYQLIDQITRIDASAHSWLLPLSLVDYRLQDKSARRVADQAFQQVILPGIDCQLTQRAMALNSQANSPADASLSYPQAQARLQEFIRQVQAYERNANRLQRLLGRSPFAKDRVLLPEFQALLEYAYRTPLPVQVKARTGLLPTVLDSLNNRNFNVGLSTPPQFRQKNSQHIVDLSAQLDSLMNDELNAGNKLLQQLQQRQQPILPKVQQFTAWLTWIRSAWLGSSASSNPLLKEQTDLAASLQPLIIDFGYPADTLAQASAQIDAARQYPLAMQTLRRMTLPGYGALFVGSDQQISFNPALQEEMIGLNGLSTLDYMRIDPLLGFTCQGKLANWSPSQLDQANQYALSYSKFVSQPTLKNSRPDALYRQLARYQLELAMNHSLQLAQNAASDMFSNPAASNAESRQSRDSSNFGKIAPALLAVQKQFRTFGMDGSATKLGQCVRQYSNDQLGQIALLAEQSQLYPAPFQPPSNAPDSPFFDLGSTPVIKDMLARQVSRVQVLSDYAAPILDYLNQAEPAPTSSSENTSNATYWNNTSNELKKYVQGKDPNAQASLLDNLFLKEFPDLQTGNCNKILAAYQSPALGNDLFSSHRQQLEKSVQMRCKGERYAQAQSAYLAIATRFNRELAGRYPFGALEAEDASLATVKAFFSDYNTQRDALVKLVTGLNDSYWSDVRRFLGQLDDVGKFLGGNLIPADSAASSDSNDALLHLNVNFKAMPTAATGSDQISRMSLLSGSKDITFPNGGNSMEWQYGQPLVLDLSWANLSLWRPAYAVKVTDLQVEGSTASFVASGNWSLLRMIERHVPKTGSRYDPRDASRLLLQFDVPVINSSAPGKAVSDNAHIFLSMKLSNAAASGKSNTPLKLPAAFPRQAPQ